MNVVELPFKVKGDRVLYGEFTQMLILWNECNTPIEEIDEMARETGSEFGSIRFEDNQPVSARGN